MSDHPWLSFDPKLTWDGLLTFLGGLLAFLAILYQVRRTDRGLRQQFEAEKQAREKNAEARGRAITRAILFEIDMFYRYYVNDILALLTNRENKTSLPFIKPVGSECFAVYRGNATYLGEMPNRLTQAVVGFYGVAQEYIATLAEYSQRSAIAMRTGNAPDLKAAYSLLPHIGQECRGMTGFTYFTCGLLSEYAGVEFSFPTIGVANAANVDEDTRKHLEKAIEELCSEGQANQKLLRSTESAVGMKTK